MNAETIENAQAAQGGIHCGICGRTLTKKNLSYILIRQFGRAEFKPICPECQRARNAVIRKSSEHSESSELDVVNV